MNLQKQKWCPKNLSFFMNCENFHPFHVDIQIMMNSIIHKVNPRALFYLHSLHTSAYSHLTHSNFSLGLKLSDSYIVWMFVVTINIVTVINLWTCDLNEFNVLIQSTYLHFKMCSQINISGQDRHIGSFFKKINTVVGILGKRHINWHFS